jgi:putative Mg2+ transporter-C (MgtC) family protein
MLEMFIKLVLASLFGALIGLQREFKDRPAGLRTHTLVALASCLFTVISMTAFSFKADPSRIAANVAVGIGFIGAGTIIKQGNIIVGLTTAASLWTVSAIGVAVGSGQVLVGFISTLLALSVLTAFKWVEERIGKKRQLEIELELSSSDLEKALDMWKNFSADQVKVEFGDGKIVLHTTFRVKDEEEIKKIINKAYSEGNIRSIRWL